MRTIRLGRPVAVALIMAMVTAGCADDPAAGDTRVDDTSESTSSEGASSAVDATSDSAPAGTKPSDTQSTVAVESTTDEQASSGESGPETSFSISIAEPAAIDPSLMQDIEAFQVVRLLFETLTSLDPELRVVPGVADQWSVADDGVTWTFNLNPDATFSDGRPVVAADFVYSFARAADPDLAAVSAYQGLPIKGWAEVNESEPSGAIGDVLLKGVTAVDDHRLTIVTEEPFALLPKVLTYPVFAPIAPEYLDTEEEAASYAEQPIGNGPYMMDGPWEHNSSISIVRSPSFHGTPGVTDRIEFRMFADLATSFREFEAGTIDIGRGLNSSQIAGARDTYGERFLSTPTGVLTYIGFPTRLAPYDNADLRRALSLAVDREAIAERILAGTAVAATGVVPTQVPGALTVPCDACTYDPERAVELFEQAGGFPDDTMIVYDISDDGTETLDPILSSWRQLFGIEIEVRSFEFAQYLEETTAENLEGPYELGWVWDYPSGYSFLSPLFESTSSVNVTGWSNAEFDAELASARTAPDEEAGLPFLANAQAIAESEMSLIPLTFLNDVGVYSERLANVIVDAGAAWRLELIEVVPG